MKMKNENEWNEKKNDWKENPKYIQACCDFILGGGLWSSKTKNKSEINFLHQCSCDNRGNTMQNTL